MSDSTGANLSEEERRAIFAAELASPAAPSGRSLRPSMPPKVVWYVALAFAVLGLGGVVLDHFFGGPVDTSAPTTVPTTTTTIASGHPLPTTALTYIGLKPLGPSPAPPISLYDSLNRRWSLANERGKVVIVAFYSMTCNDICPVLGAELREALTRLQGLPVEVAIVNTDVQNLLAANPPPALTVPGLVRDKNVVALTDSLPTMVAVWTHYGVTVDVMSSNRVVHNDVLYFIDPRGRLRALATPFGDESRSGAYHLSAADEARFAQGIAEEASSLTR